MMFLRKFTLNRSSKSHYIDLLVQGEDKEHIIFPPRGFW
jgi:hypothetical protein